MKGCSVLVNAKSLQRFRDSKIYDLKVKNVQFLQNVKNISIESITIGMDSMIDEETVDDLLSYIDDQPGETQVYFTLHDSETNQQLRLRSRAKKVKLNRQFMDFLSQSPVLEYHIN